MGIYFDETTPEEDSKIILDGIKNNKITEDFYIICNSCNFSVTDTKNDEDLVWISTKDSRQHLVGKYSQEIITINGIEGYLTKTGIDYIYRYLMSTGRFSTTY